MPGNPLNSFKLCLLINHLIALEADSITLTNIIPGTLAITKNFKGFPQGDSKYLPLFAYGIPKQGLSEDKLTTNLEISFQVNAIQKKLIMKNYGKINKATSMSSSYDLNIWISGIQNVNIF